MFLGKKRVLRKGLLCPDCGAEIVRRTSEMMHTLLQRVYFLCRNVECGATFCGTTEITHRMSPGLIPNQSVSLPYTSRAIGTMKRAGYDVDAKVLSGNFAEPIPASEITRRRRSRIKMMLIAGYKPGRIQEELFCSFSAICSVRDQMKNSSDEDFRDE